MRFSTLALLSSLPLALSAQITITDSEMPHAGDELLRTRAVANPFLNYGNTGAGFTWNFGNLVAQEQATKDYASVNSTNFIYAIFYADIFFNPNRANHATTGSDIPFYEQLPIEDPYTFFYRSSSVYKKVGYGAAVAGFPVPIPMEDQDVIYELPLDYGDAHTDNSSYQIDVPSLAYYGYSQTRTNEVDGWGAITTPAGSFDVLRVKTTLAGRDSINLDSLGLGFAIERPLVTEYKWLANGYRVPILQINTTEIFGLEIITEVWFYDEPRSVNVVEPFTLSLCPGNNVQVPYEATGAFNQGGFLVQANIFRAQLSDANGDFTNAVNIGSVTATTSGTINATIPANTPVGTGYRIRVIATNPAYVGEDNGQDISIGLPPIASASAFGTTTFCNGGDVLLQANLGGSNDYQWQLDGSDIAGANDAEYTADAAGSYTVTVSDACGTDVSDAIVVSVNEVPAHTLMQDVFTACEGESITITAVDLSGQSDLDYQWLLDGVAIDGATLNTIAADENGAYMVQATNTVTGCSFTTDETVIMFDPLPVASIIVASNTTFCVGGSVELTADMIAGATYQWTLDGVAIDGATTNMFVTNASGTYAVIITGATGCSANAANTIAVLVLEAPPTITITASAATTFCAGGDVELVADNVADASYQWSHDGVVIDGATANTITANVSGNYAVTITNLSGCSTNATNSIDVTILDAPATPTIAQEGTMLMASGSGTFQWYLDGSQIDGATEANYTTTSNGSYTVQTTDGNGCTSISDPYVFLSTSIVERTTAGISLYPNPAHDQVTVIGDEAIGEIRVFDATGRMVMMERATTERHVVALQGLAPGTYAVLTALGTVRLAVE